MEKYATENLAELSANLLLSYLFETVLPALLQKQREELGIINFSMKDLLKEYGLTKISVSTVYCWLEQLGFKYNIMNKCYYVDNHASPETVIY